VLALTSWHKVEPVQRKHRLHTRDGDAGNGGYGEVVRLRGAETCEQRQRRACDDVSPRTSHPA